jgi:radical SAM superfamily enzyme YgiQ (UPF0313 family)
MLTEKLSAMERPDVIGITSGMTYWYPGLFKTIQAVKSFFKGVPVILGGIYATLCHDHAIRFSGADFVIRGSGKFEIFNIIQNFSNLDMFLDSRFRTLNSELRTGYIPVREGNENIAIGLST